MKLDTLPVWIRVFDLPLSMMTEAMGKIIGAKMGAVKKVAVDDRGRAWDEFLRIRVEHPIHNPLSRWVKLKGKDGTGVQKFDVKYERIPRFCFFCGHIGHTERDCNLPPEKQSARFGLNLRASPFKRFEHRSWRLPGLNESIAKRNIQFGKYGKKAPNEATSHLGARTSGQEPAVDTDGSQKGDVGEESNTGAEGQVKSTEGNAGPSVGNHGDLEAQEMGEVQKLAEQWEKMGKQKEKIFDQPMIQQIGQRRGNGTGPRPTQMSDDGRQVCSEIQDPVHDAGADIDNEVINIKTPNPPASRDAYLTKKQRSEGADKDSTALIPADKNMQCTGQKGNGVTTCSGRFRWYKF